MLRVSGGQIHFALLLILGGSILLSIKCDVSTLLLGRKAMTNLDSILKSRDITQPTTVCLVKTMVFPIVMDGCEIWTIKKGVHQRTDGFEMWCWRRLLRVPWTEKRLNLSILKKISSEYSLDTHEQKQVISRRKLKCMLYKKRLRGKKINIECIYL